MKTTWIVLANAARARIFEAEGERKPVEVRSLVHPESRMAGRELGDDRAGHTERPGTESAGAGSAYQPPTGLREKEHRRFAHEVAQVLDEAVYGGRCGALLLVASNPFLGELRGCLGDAAARAVVGSVARDLTEIPALELQHRLAELLAEHGEGAA